jgi:hypothetical protein
MFNYIYTDSNNNVHASKSSNSEASPFVVLFKRAKDTEWMGIASAATIENAEMARNHYAKQFTVRGEFDIVEATTVTATEWDVYNAHNMARLNNARKVA